MKSSVNKVLLGSATVLALGAAGQVAQAATTGVLIQAIVLSPVDISQTQSLNFGSLTESGAGGTITVDNTGTPATSPGVTSIGGTIQAGGFKLLGSIGKAVKVTAAAKATLTNGGGGTMTVNAFTIEGAAGTFVHTMVAATDSGFRLGGTLNVGAGQATGTYNGSVVLTAIYQ